MNPTVQYTNWIIPMFRTEVISSGKTLETAKMFQRITGVIPAGIYNCCFVKDDVETLEKLCQLQPIDWGKVGGKVELKKNPVQCLAYFYNTEKELFEKTDKLHVDDKNYIKWLIKWDAEFKQQGIHDFIKNPLWRKYSAKKYIKSQNPDVKKIDS